MNARLYHLAPDPDGFAALMQRRSLAGFHAEPMPPLRMHDRYLDTAAADLLAAGWTLRLRTQGGQTRITFRPLDGHTAGVSQVGAETDTLPEGVVRLAVRSLAGAEPLEALLVLRQYRTPRAIYDGQRFVGVLSLDVVTDDGGAVPETWHEVGTRLDPAGTAADLRRLGDDLAELGFEPSERTKFERAFFRLSLDSDGPILLLPDERDALDTLRHSDSALARRRADVVVLAADGLPTRTISYKADLSPSRVRHWKHAFRHERMGIFAMDEPETTADATEAAVTSGFRVSEIVEPTEAQFVDVLEAVMERSTRHPGTPMLKVENG